MASSKPSQTFIDPTALVHESAIIGDHCKVWAFVQIMNNAQIGNGSIIGNGAYIDRNVILGKNVRVHNKALLYDGLIVEDDVFIGPGVCFTNDALPKSGRTRNLDHISWKVGKGASIGANSTILPDVNIGENALIGAGSVVTKDVAANTVVYGNPARVRGHIDDMAVQITKKGS